MVFRVAGTRQIPVYKYYTAAQSLVLAISVTEASSIAWVVFISNKIKRKVGANQTWIENIFC